MNRKNTPQPTLRLYAIEHASRANGPGRRAVVWVQGCTLSCPGCFNPQTHDARAGFLIPCDELAQRLLALADLEGLTISGGEPLQQAEALLRLLQQIRARSSLSILVFSGYTLAEIRRLPSGSELLSQIDVLVAGRYDRQHPASLGLLASANQRIHLLSTRYRASDLTGAARTEVILHRDGTMTLSGIAPARLSLPEPPGCHR